MNKHNFYALFSLLLLLFNPSFAKAQTPSVARRWNEVMLQAIREDLARPPVQARNLFHVSMAMWDAWAAYDTLSAETYLLGKTVGTYTCPFDGVPVPPDIAAARNKAISFAAFKVLNRRFINSPNSFISITRFRNLMNVLGYDWTFSSTDYHTGDPAALGNYIGDCVGFYGLSDGANESGNYVNLNYIPVNPALNPLVLGDPTLLDANRWQPLILNNAVDQNGNPIPALQQFQSPEWGKVVPFAIPDSQKNVYIRNGIPWTVYHDPGPPPILDVVDGGGTSDEYRWNFNLVPIWASHLDPNDGVNWDISPASVGNNTWYPSTFQEYQDFYKITGGDPGQGWALNPKTGQPYPPQIVPRGDYTRVLAQFWADGPNSETPPGHWFTILNKVMDHPDFVRRYNGTGPILDPLEYDVKAYLTLGGAVHDAAVAAWGIKGWYDGIRAISAERWMADKGQSSNPALPNYNVAGIKLVPGYIEQIALGDPLAGVNNQNVGKIKMFTWQGFDSISNPLTDIAGVGWILAGKWWPFQKKTFVTPPFAGYISGHSTYSRAAAEAITLLTGDPFFPGGVGEFHFAANTNFAGLEKGPSVDVTLQWATYRDASDQCSLSRIWGGIHPPSDDIPGRKIGAIVGTSAFYKAKTYFYHDDFDQDGYSFGVDCDDQNATVFPGAPELCDGLDNNCDGQIDEGFVLHSYFADADGDGFGDLSVPLNTCLTDAPIGYVTNSMDCFDNDPTSYPGAPELCDGLDNDCNGLADDGLTFTLYYEDADGDGFGTDNSNVSSCAAVPPIGFVTNNLDCNDNDPSIHPNEPEICDNLDNDCNGLTDDGLSFTTYYLDADNDGFGSLTNSTENCTGIAPAGFVDNNLDCDDSNASVYPNATEICDNLDNDCNGLTDDGLVFTTYYVDADHDGFGSGANSTENCLGVAPAGFVSNNLDCDDTNAAINPDALEICDEMDNNCNGQTDEGLPQFIYFQDADGDGFGGTAVAISTCSDTPPTGYVTNNLDCDDANPAVNPNAIEIIDGIDNNCDGSTGTSELNAFVRTYPNPVYDVLTISIENKLTLTVVQIVTMEGKVLRSQSLDFSAGQASISFAGLPQGVYLLRIAEIEGGKYWLQRVVKM